MSASIVSQLGTTGITVADFNGDGKLDIASPAGISLGNGGGTFRAPIAFPPTATGSALAVGDLNNDGKIDLVVETANFNCAVLLGSGDGSFQAPIALPVLGADQGGALLLGDFDTDGALDLVTAGPIGVSRQSVSIYHGDGTFARLFFNDAYKRAFARIGRLQQRRQARSGGVRSRGREFWPAGGIARERRRHFPGSEHELRVQRDGGVRRFEWGR
jgi:hypothetical protein